MRCLGGAAHGPDRRENSGCNRMLFIGPQIIPTLSSRVAASYMRRNSLSDALPCDAFATRAYVQIIHNAALKTAFEAEALNHKTAAGTACQ
jgi:hypothetical protein